MMPPEAQGHLAKLLACLSHRWRVDGWQKHRGFRRDGGIVEIGTPVVELTWQQPHFWMNFQACIAYIAEQWQAGPPVCAGVSVCVCVIFCPRWFWSFKFNRGDQ